MMCRSKTSWLSGLYRSVNRSRATGNVRRGGGGGRCAAADARRRGLGLVEVVASLVILALFSSGVMVVVNRCMAWATDSIRRVQAFEVARDNIEKLLAADSLKESSESGDSEKYPGITWETTVETFYEPVTSRMWVRAVCAAKYEDADGEEQTIELRHWLTNLTKEQVLALLERGEKEIESLGGQAFETIEEAAAYAGVDVETMEKWISEDGLQVLPDGSIPKPNVDLYAETGGNPPPEQKANQITTPEELAGPEGTTGDPDSPEGPTEPEEKKTYTEEDLREMGVPEELIPVVLPLFNS